MKARVRQENEKIKIKKDERIGSIWIYKKDPKNLKKIFDPVSSQSKKEAHVNLEDEKTSSKAGSKLIPTTRYELNGFFFFWRVWRFKDGLLTPAKSPFLSE